MYHQTIFTYVKVIKAFMKIQYKAQILFLVPLSLIFLKGRRLGAL